MSSIYRGHETSPRFAFSRALPSSTRRSGVNCAMRCWSAMSVRSTQPRSEVGAQSPHNDPPLQAGEGISIDADLIARRSRAAFRRRLIVYALRLGFAVVWIGSWELSSRLNWVDPFFVGQ